MVDIENHEQLAAYLIQNGYITPDEKIKAQTLHGGVSNRTVWVMRDNGEAWVLKQALEKLRVQVDWFCSPERVHREAMGIRWLEQLAPTGCTVPLVFEDHEHHIIAMHAVPQPHQNWKTMLLNGDIQPGHFTQFAALLSAFHTSSHEQINELSHVFDDRSYMEQLRIEPFYEYPASMIQEARPFLDELIQDTRAINTALVHGDYSPKNILVHQNKLILLDHEVIHFGDPAFDVGFSMAHFLSKAHALASKRTGFTDLSLQYWTRYFSQVHSWVDTDFESRSARHTLACLLARAAGRSTMDYFEDHHKQHQKNVVVTLMQTVQENMKNTINQFINGLNHV